MTDEHVRTAGVRQEDRLAAGMKSQDLVAAVRESREIDSTTRVYVKEWLFERRFHTAAEALEHLDVAYRGRLLPEDMKAEQDSLDGTWVAWTRRPNVNSEWKRPEQAQAWAEALVADGVAAEEDVEAVVRNSRREHVIAQYGVLKLTNLAIDAITS